MRRLVPLLLIALAAAGWQLSGTPGNGDRGAGRILAGGQPPEVFYNSDDHYRRFRPVARR